MLNKKLLPFAIMTTLFITACSEIHSPSSNPQACANIRYELQQYNVDPQQMRTNAINRNYQSLSHAYDQLGCKSLADFGQAKPTS